MRCHAKVSALAIAAGAIAVSWTPIAGLTPLQERRQATTIVAIGTNVSGRSASLDLSLSNGETITLRLSGGSVFLNGNEIATYRRGGSLETAWRNMLERASELDPAEMLQQLREWNVADLDEAAAATRALMIAPFAYVSTTPLENPVEPTPPHSPLASAADGGAGLTIDLSRLDALEALGELESIESLEPLELLEVLQGLDVRALRTDIRKYVEDARIAGADSARDAIYAQDDDLTQRSILGQMGGDVAGLLAAFVAMCCLGLGLVFFAPRQLEIVADTVHNSFWRSFFAGLFAQPLVVPAFGMLLLGLTLTVVGILVIPFATIAFAVALALAVLGGYLAVARSIGEAYLRRRMSRGFPMGVGLPYRYMAYGLAGLLAIWIPAVVFAWIPIAGTILSVCAIIFTWMIATAGFGATILSRAGLRSTFSRRFDQALSDEYLYRTPQATPVVSARVRHPRSGS